jgi:hypothetical protein
VQLRLLRQKATRQVLPPKQIDTGFSALTSPVSPIPVEYRRLPLSLNQASYNLRRIKQLKIQ